MLKCKQSALRSQAGFTLVELAIVMIIIGLLIGGVLKGQQLITNAQISATVAQEKAIDAATTSFRDQFNGTPGDLVTPATRLSNCVNNCALPGDGDGKVDAAGVAITFGAASAGEQLAYWGQLNAAGLLTGVSEAGGALSWGNQMPASKVNGGGFDVGYNNGVAALNSVITTVAGAVQAGHYLALHGTPTGGVTAVAPDTFLTPNLAARIDTKIDDGSPNAGSVLAAGAATCTNGGAITSVYAESTASAVCNLYIKFQN